MVGTFARGLALAVAWAAVGVPAHAVGTTDITTSRDTWLEQSQPDSNRGTDTPLRASGAPGGAEVPLLYFDLSPIPANEVVTAASLRIKVDTADSAPVDVAEVLGAWTEPVATWNNTAALVDRSRTWATFTPSATGPITVDVTGLVQVWTTTRTGQGLALVATTSGQSRYDSREVAAAPQRPVLQITTASDAAVVDVGLTVAVDKTTAAVGDTLTYTVTATNYGGAAAASVSVGDFVPANTSFLGATTTQGTYTRLIGTWSVGSLAADASATLTLSVAVQPSAAGTTVTNTGFLWFTSPSDGASGNDSMAAATSVPDGSTVDLAATKSVDNPAPTTGQTVEFTITVMNGGGSDATGVALADSLPSGLTYQWDTPSVGDYDPITGIWQVGNLGTGATATLHVAATVNPGTEGMTLVNRVSVLAVDQPDTDPANDADSASVSVVSADLFATVGVDDANPREGDAITFTVGVGDSGPSAANGIVLAAALPPGLSFQSAAPGVGTYDSGTGRWTVGALASGQTVSMDLVALVDGGTGGDALDVVAVVTDANEPDPDGSNDADTVRVVVQSADVAVTVGIDDAAPREGDTVHLTVRAANLGPNDVAGVQILDTLPAGLSMSTWTASHGSWNPGSGVWDLGALSALSSDSLSITATIDAGTGGQTLDNAASVIAADLADLVLANDADTVNVVVQSADLAVTKTPSLPFGDEGDTITWTVVVHNEGPFAAAGVQLSDPLPAGLTWTNDTASQGSYDPFTGLWTVGSLASGSAATLAILTSLDPGTAGTDVTNTATSLGSDLPDPVPANDAWSAGVHVRAADLRLTKAASPASPSVGTTLTYTITLSNFGPDSATTIAVVDSLPAGVTYTGYGASAGVYDLPSGTWTLPVLAGSGTAALTLHATIDAGTEGLTIVNRARVAAADEADPVPGNEADSASVTVANIVPLETADLSLSQFLSDPGPREGDPVRITLGLTNLGPDATTSVAVTEALPPGLTLTGATPSQGSWNGGSGLWTVGSLALGDSVTLALDATVDPGTAGATLSPQATVTASDVPDPAGGNNSVSSSLVVEAADLAVALAVDDATPNEGDLLTFTVSLTNAGPDAVGGVVVDDTLPVGLAYSSATADRGSYASGTGLWSVGTVAASETVQLQLLATVETGTAGRSIEDTAHVSAADQGDPVAANDTSRVSIVVRSADLAVTKTVDDSTPDQGQRMRFTVTVANAGPDDATGVVLSDPLPAGLAFAAASASAGSYASGSGDWTLGPLAQGATAQLLLDADVLPGTGGTSIVNTASIGARDVGDPVAANDSGSATLDVNEVVGISVTALQATASARPGASGKGLITLVLSNSGQSSAALNSVALANRTSGPGTIGQRDAEFGPTFLYRDDGDLIFEPTSDVVIASGTIAAGVLTFPGINVTVTPGGTRALHVGGGPSLGARDGDVLDLSLEAPGDLVFGGPQTFVTPFPVDPVGGLTVDGMVVGQCVVTTLSNANVTLGATRALALQVRLPANGYEADVLSALRIVNGGNAVATTDIAAVKVWLDGGDGVWGNGGGDDTLAGTATASAGSWSLTGLSAALPPGGRLVFASVDVAVSATVGRTIALAVPAPDGITVSSGNDGPLDVSLAPTRTLAITNPAGSAIVTASQGSGTLLPGDPLQSVFSFVVRNQSVRAETLLTVRAENLSTGSAAATPADLDADWQTVQLQRDPSFGSSGSGSFLTEPSVASFSGGSAMFTLHERIAAGDSALFRVLGAPSLRVRDGDFLDLRLPAGALTFAGSGPTVTGLPASPSGAFLVDGMSAAQVSATATGGGLFTGDVRRLVLDVVLPANGYEDDTLSRLDLVNLGTAGSDELARLEAWADDGGGAFDAATDRRIGDLVHTGGRWEITGLSEPVSVTAGLHLYVTVDVSEIASPGHTVHLAIPGPPDPGIGMLSANDGPVDRSVAGNTLTISTVDRITLSAVAVASRRVSPGETGIALLSLDASNSYGVQKNLTELHVHDTSTGSGSQAQRDSQFERLVLWGDDGDGIPEGAGQDTLLAVSFFDGGEAVFGGLHWSIGAGQTRRLFVRADLSIAFAADGDVLSLQVLGDADAAFATATAVAAGWPLDSGARDTVDGMVAAQIKAFAPPAITIGPGEGPALALDAILPGRGYDGDRLTSFSVENAGTADTGDIASLRLWRDGGNGAFDGGAGDDADLGILASFGDRWTHPALAESLQAGGARFFVSATVSAAPRDSATIRLLIPQDGLAVASGNDGPRDAAVESANTITLSTSVLLTSLAIHPEASTLDSTVTVTMSVRNVHPTEAMDNVTPSALVPSGAGVLTLLSGPSPASLTLAPGVTDSVSWVYRADGPGPVRLSGSAEGEEAGTGVPHRSLTVESGQHTVFLRAQDLNLYAVESMPFSISRGQTGIVPISLTFENPAGADGSDILVTRLRLRVEDEGGIDVVPAALLSRVVVNEGAIVYSDRTALETTGAEVDLPLSPALRVEGSGSSRQATVALAIDISDTTTVGSFRIQVVDATWISAQDATSGGPVSVNLVDPPSFPIASGLARVVADAIRLDVAGASSPDGSAGRGQAGVELMTLQLLNTDPAGLAADVRVPSFAVHLLDSAGLPVASPGDWLDGIRVATDVLVHLDRSLAADGATVPLSLSPLVSVPVNTPVTVRVTGSIATAAPLGTVQLVLADASTFIARDANTTAPVPVLYATDPLAGRRITIQDVAATLRASGDALMPATVPVGSKDVTALDVGLVHPGAPGGAAALVDELVLECRDGGGLPLVPATVVDRVYVLSGVTVVGLVTAPPTAGSRIVVPLAGVRLAASDTLSLTVRFDAELTAPPIRLEVSVPAGGIAARDENLGDPVGVVPDGGGSFPLRSGLAQLLQPSREIAVGFVDRMPAVLAADGSRVVAATLTLRNPAPPTAGPLRLAAVTLHAADADLVPIALGGAVSEVVAQVGEGVWASVTTVDAADETVRLAPTDTLEIAPGASVDVDWEIRLRPGSDATSLRLGLAAGDLEITSGAGEFLGVSILAESGQSLPFWTESGTFGGTSLAESWSNFPNPFAAGREGTRFAFYLPRDGRVTVKVRSIRGDDVRVLLDGASLGAGLHQDTAWDGRNGRGDVVRNGVYVAEIGVAYDDGTSEALRRKVAVLR